MTPWTRVLVCCCCSWCYSGCQYSFGSARRTETSAWIRWIDQEWWFPHRWIRALVRLPPSSSLVKRLETSKGDKKQIEWNRYNIYICGFKTCVCIYVASRLVCVCAWSDNQFNSIISPISRFKRQEVFHIQG
jgi:hypothetical protein